MYIVCIYKGKWVKIHKKREKKFEFTPKNLIESLSFPKCMVVNWLMLCGVLQSSNSA